MQKTEFLSLRQAAKAVGVSHVTIANWCKWYGVGELIDGRWRIQKSGIDRILRLKGSLKVPRT